MLRYLLDTNIVSEPARSQPKKRVLSRFEKHKHEVAMPSIVWHELVYGVERLKEGQRRTFLQKYLYDVVRPAVPILPFDEAAAYWLGCERARLEAKGMKPPFVDGMIAGTAAVYDLILVTRNTSDFSGYAGLHVEIWFND